MAALEATSYSFTLMLSLRNYQLLVTGLCLAAALLVGALVIALINKWRKHNEQKEDSSPNAQLAQFRSLYEAGTISQEEFDSLRAVLGGRMRGKVETSLREDEPTRGASRPQSETPVKPPPADEPPADSPEKGVGPA